MEPVVSDEASGVVAIMYRGSYGTPVKVTFTPEEIGLSSDNGYIVSEVFDNVVQGEVAKDTELKVNVNPNGETAQIKLRLDIYYLYCYTLPLLCRCSTAPF